MIRYSASTSLWVFAPVARDTAMRFSLSDVLLFCISYLAFEYHIREKHFYTCGMPMALEPVALHFSWRIVINREGELVPVWIP